MPISRRSFLAGAVAAPAIPGTAPFRHRGYVGWITDLASEPDSDAAWPSMRLNDRLLTDYGESFRVLQSLGFNEISIWGLYVSRAWPLDLETSVPADRGRMVEKVIDAAHGRGIRVLSGLGVYSWGFDEIIRANGKLNRGNPQAMCASEPESWEWMRRVVDFVFRRFPIDGVSMQSADQGRCKCVRCARYTDAQYHALLNTRTSQYIRANWPKSTIGVNSWGLRFEEPGTLEPLVRMSAGIDYLIDVHDSSRKRDPGYRREIIRALKCQFGTLGGPQVEPPQHWQRDRWFLPVARRTAQHLAELAADGGRACEYFFHILKNPGDEITTRVAGKVLSAPTVPWDRHLCEATEETYEPYGTAARDRIAELLLQAEDAYFRCLPVDTCGTISLEPLVSDRPGPPVYLTRRLTREQRQAYAAGLARIGAEFARLRPEVKRKDKMDFTVRAIANARGDALGEAG